MLPRLFHALAPVTLTLVFLVILAGGTVRTTGSGMGCPDWPKCFGQYIPPTDVQQLPVDYKTRFAVKGREIADFDAFKTWVEYINRLLGALLGVVIAIQLLASLSVIRTDSVVVMLCAALLVVTGFVGWLGSVVVATDLAPAKITTHMLASLCIVALAIAVWHRTELRFGKSNAQALLSVPLSVPLAAVEATLNVRMLTLTLWGALALTLLQVLLGTQVREQIDIIAQTLGGRWRDLWIAQLSRIFEVYRALSVVVLGVNAYIIVVLWRGTGAGEARLRGLAVALAGLLVAEILLGVTMAYLAVPKAAQPLHLLSATGIFGVQIALLLCLQSYQSSRQGNETMRVTT